MRQQQFVAAVLASAFAAPLALAGPDWVEFLDAGDSVTTAQEISISSQLRTVTGELRGNALDGPVDYEDCFLFNITDPTTFQISTTGTQVQLSLFRIQFGEDEQPYAFGLLANNNGPGPAQLTRFATDFTEAFVSEPGTYMLAISLEGRIAGNEGGPIFNFAEPNEISGPDGQGGDGFLDYWYGQPTGAGSYTMALEGSGGTNVPAPGVGVLLAGGLLHAARRRRR